MIKVNLLRDVTGGVYSPAPSGVGVEGGTTAGDTTGGNLDLVIKGLLVAFPIILTIATRSYLINVKQAEIVKLEGHEATLEQKLKSFEPGLKDIEKFQEEKKKLNSQLDVIRQLSRERLKSVKSLDALQGLIPMKAWLSRLKMTGNKVTISGYASDDLVIAEFMKNLSASIFFSNVALDDSSEDKFEDEPVKKFIIKCNLENF